MIESEYGPIISMYGYLLFFFSANLSSSTASTSPPYVSNDPKAPFMLAVIRAEIVFKGPELLDEEEEDCELEEEETDSELLLELEEEETDSELLLLLEEEEIDSELLLELEEEEIDSELLLELEEEELLDDDATPCHAP